MSFDKDTRNLLAKTVAACRRRLVEDVTDQLRGVFGLHPDGTVLPIDKLTHLSPDQHAAARRLRDLLDHYIVGAAGKGSDRRKAAYERMALEISFTALNRLAALRLCEERGLVIECVRKGTSSAGFQMFERISGGALGGRYDTYRVFLECMFDELAGDLGVLFDRMTPQSAVFPSERCMEDVLAELNKPELTHLWTEDETIGWVYQYFNPPEERKAMREASQAPRNSRELAVRNQFFTPRYVVEFLTDNTLGRIWYEMRKGDTALKGECRYLVRRPNEVFLGPGEKAPAEKGDETDLSQEELLKRPVYIEHRPKKDPRDLRVLDPACGSGHFLLYAFDLLERIYEEAWGDPESPASEITGRPLREEFRTLDDLRRETPKLIVEHNLHGIDIDPRAVQIAALALWLRAQKTWKNLGLKAQERPRIARSNIVTAEPMPGEEDMRREFTASLKPRVLGQIVDEVFEKMKLAGEAGSLLKIEEEIKDAVAAAKAEYIKELRKEREEAGYLPGMAPAREPSLFDFTDLHSTLTTDHRPPTTDFWDQAEDRILDALKEYAERAENGLATRRRLFAEDAARGFAFIDLCRKRYDVVLMNPPFGESVDTVSEYITRTTPSWCKNLASAFTGRMAAMVKAGGRIGTVTDRTVLIKSSYEDFRRQLLFRELRIGPLADLGWGVLDANVEVSAAVFSRSPQQVEKQLEAFFDCRLAEEKATNLSSIIFENEPTDLVTWIDPKSFKRLPNAAVAHDMPEVVIHWFNVHPALKDGPAKALQGHAIKMDWYGRFRWEVTPGEIGPHSKWSSMYNGGSFSRFYSPLVDVVRWNGDGTFLKFHDSTRWSNAEHQQKPGIGYGKRGDVLDAHIVPPGHVFTVEGLFVLPEKINDAWFYLGILNSPLVSVILNYYCGQHKHAGYVDLLPVPYHGSHEVRGRISELAQQGWHLQRDLDTTNEISPLFLRPAAPMLFHSLRNFNEILILKNEYEDAISKTVDEIECAVEGLYGLSSSDRVRIVPAIDTARKGLSSNDDAEDRDLSSSSLPTSSHAAISYLVGAALGRWDVRIAIDHSLAPKLPDPFDPLPVCPPGMLVGPDGLPAEPNRIASEEWLRARPDANTLPPEDSVKTPTIPDSEYPLRISWDGVLVDDPGGFSGQWAVVSGQPHKDDIVRRVREVLDLLWKDKAHEIEQEACDILGVSDLRDYFRKPAGFFQDHLKRYSKSRRKAPIYWPLSTASGSYTIWLYYHRLTDQTLYMVVNKYVEPKISEVERGIGGIENDLKSASGRDATRLTDRLNEARAFLGELRELREELLRIAALPYKPDLNDGVIINAAPFHNLFRLRSWAKDTEDCWKKLERGEYDWSHLAYTIWPERVREVCRTDRSIAIAHGLEDLCEVEAPEPKKKGGRGRRKKEAAR